MKIPHIEARISPLQAGVLLFFAIFLLYSYSVSGSPMVLLYGIPLLIALAAIPMLLRHMSQSQYEHLIPVYEAEAQKVRIKGINLNMVGKPVQIEGVVERVYFSFLDRPQYLVADRSGGSSGLQACRASTTFAAATARTRRRCRCRVTHEPERCSDGPTGFSESSVPP